MHKAARKIVDEAQGEFPDSVEQLIKLPGIGRSTAGAIRSIAFQNPPQSSTAMSNEFSPDMQQSTAGRHGGRTEKRL